MVSFHFLRIVCLIGCFGYWAGCSAFAQENAGWGQWESAHDSYIAGQYDAALRSMLSQPKADDPAYYFDLGTISYRMGRTGAAVGYFEKANRLKRHDPDIRHNLELARSDLSRTLGEGHLDPASAWTETLADQVSLEEVRGVLGVFSLILVLFWLRAYRRSRRFLATLTQPAPLIGTIALALVGVLYLLELQAYAHPAAIALERQAIRSGPGASYNELAQAESGMLVRLLGEVAGSSSPDAATATPSGSDDQWLQVRYNHDGVGWVRASGFIQL